MKKKKIIPILIIIILMLIPIPTKLKDGTSTEYKALLYSITKYHIINQDSIKGNDDGFKINADYEGKDISYYFMSEIRENK